MLASVSRALLCNPCKQNLLRPLTFAPNVTHNLKYEQFNTSCVVSEKKETSAPMQLEQDNFVKRMYNRLFSGVPVAKLRSSGYILLTICAQRPDIVKFFETFNMPDTFYSWFLITELHVWLLGSRLMGEGDEGRIVRNSLVEALWVDCDTRAKALGDMSTSTRSKHIASVAEEFQASLFIYDEGISGSDMVLANALWRRFFLSMHEIQEGDTPLPDPEKLLLLVNYVRRVASYLDKMDGVDIIVRNKVEWPSLVE